MNSIKKMRKQKKLTQNDIACMLGVAPSTVTKWETGVSYPRTDLLPEIARIFECRIDDLFSTEDSVAN